MSNEPKLKSNFFPFNGAIWEETRTNDRGEQFITYNFSFGRSWKDKTTNEYKDQKITIFNESDLLIGSQLLEFMYRQAQSLKMQNAKKHKKENQIDAPTQTNGEVIDEYVKNISPDNIPF
jgi:hypothetical protein